MFSNFGAISFVSEDSTAIFSYSKGTVGNIQRPRGDYAW